MFPAAHWLPHLPTINVLIHKLLQGSDSLQKELAQDTASKGSNSPRSLPATPREACSQGREGKPGSKTCTCFWGVSGMMEIQVKLEKMGIYFKGPGHLGLLAP